MVREISKESSTVHEIGFTIYECNLEGFSIFASEHLFKCLCFGNEGFSKVRAKTGYKLK
jgi:hypothetical protein